VFLADKFCSVMRTASYFLARHEFYREDAETLWEKLHVQGELLWVEGPGRWNTLLEDLG
jgi:hypothetical protein